MPAGLLAGYQEPKLTPKNHHEKGQYQTLIQIKLGSTLDIEPDPRKKKNSQMTNQEKNRVNLMIPDPEAHPLIKEKVNSA